MDQIGIDAHKRKHISLARLPGEGGQRQSFQLVAATGRDQDLVEADGALRGRTPSPYAPASIASSAPDRMSWLTTLGVAGATVELPGSRQSPAP